MLTELIALPGGDFRMGSADFYPDEAPVHTATVAAFAIERHPVTNAQYAEFVADTGYVTVAERPLDPALYPGVAAADLLPGALVFVPTAGPVDLNDWRQWWDWAPGACWRHPFGRASGIEDRLDHPVVQVAYPDAHAYAQWAGRRLPTEAEWEYACRAGTDTPFAFGADVSLAQVNVDGNRPYAGGRKGEYRQRTVPVKALPANGWGLYQMHGNVWEWCADVPRLYADVQDPATATKNPVGPPNPNQEALRTLRGGSWFPPAWAARSAYRNVIPRGFRSMELGFRFALRSTGPGGAGSR